MSAVMSAVLATLPKDSTGSITSDSCDFSTDEDASSTDEIDDNSEDENVNDYSDGAPPAKKPLFFFDSDGDISSSSEGDTPSPTATAITIYNSNLLATSHTQGEREGAMEGSLSDRENNNQNDANTVVFDNRLNASKVQEKKVGRSDPSQVTTATSAQADKIESRSNASVPIPGSSKIERSIDGRQVSSQDSSIKARQSKENNINKPSNLKLPGDSSKIGQMNVLCVDVITPDPSPTGDKTPPIVVEMWAEAKPLSHDHLTNALEASQTSSGKKNTLTASSNAQEEREPTPFDKDSTSSSRSHSLGVDGFHLDSATGEYTRVEREPTPFFDKKTQRPSTLRMPVMNIPSCERDREPTPFLDPSRTLIGNIPKSGASNVSSSGPSLTVPTGMRAPRESTPFYNASSKDSDCSQSPSPTSATPSPSSSSLSVPGFSSSSSSSSLSVPGSGGVRDARESTPYYMEDDPYEYIHHPDHHFYEKKSALVKQNSNEEDGDNSNDKAVSSTKMSVSKQGQTPQATKVPVSKSAPSQNDKEKKSGSAQKSGSPKSKPTPSTDSITAKTVLKPASTNSQQTGVTTVLKATAPVKSTTTGTATSQQHRETKSNIPKTTVTPLTTTSQTQQQSTSAYAVSRPFSPPQLPPPATTTTTPQQRRSRTPQKSVSNTTKGRPFSPPPPPPSKTKTPGTQQQQASDDVSKPTNLRSVRASPEPENIRREKQVTPATATIRRSRASITPERSPKLVYQVAPTNKDASAPGRNESKPDKNNAGKSSIPVVSNVNNNAIGNVSHSGGIHKDDSNSFQVTDVSNNMAKSSEMSTELHVIRSIHPTFVFSQAKPTTSTSAIPSDTTTKPSAVGAAGYCRNSSGDTSDKANASPNRIDAAIVEPPKASPVFKDKLMRFDSDFPPAPLASAESFDSLLGAKIDELGTSVSPAMLFPAQIPVVTSAPPSTTLDPSSQSRGSSPSASNITSSEGELKFAQADMRSESGGAKQKLRSKVSPSPPNDKSRGIRKRIKNTKPEETASKKEPKTFAGAIASFLRPKRENDTKGQGASPTSGPEKEQQESSRSRSRSSPSKGRKGVLSKFSRQKSSSKRTSPPDEVAPKRNGFSLQAVTRCSPFGRYNAEGFSLLFLFTLVCLYTNMPVMKFICYVLASFYTFCVLRILGLLD